LTFQGNMTPQLTFPNSNTPQLAFMPIIGQNPSKPNPQTVLTVQARPQDKRGEVCIYRPCQQKLCRFVHEPGQRKCVFRPCNSTRCTNAHEPGQHMPDENLMALKGVFAKLNRCKRGHDGECTDQICSRIHGKDNMKGPQCENLGRGMCEAFFSTEGCSKSHRK
jgi:hypothetical protein